MIERKIRKPLKARSVYKLHELMQYARKSGYEQVGNVIEGLDGQYHAMMEKIIFWEERK